MKTGIQLIADERQRQIEDLGYNFENDSEYKTLALGNAAICYATLAGCSPDMRGQFRTAKSFGNPPRGWPWSVDDWKPSKGDTDAERVQELIKAGALIAAEIDRIQSKPKH